MGQSTASRSPGKGEAETPAEFAAELTGRLHAAIDAERTHPEVRRVASALLGVLDLWAVPEDDGAAEPAPAVAEPRPLVSSPSSAGSGFDASKPGVKFDRPRGSSRVAASP